MTDLVYPTGIAATSRCGVPQIGKILVGIPGANGVPFAVVGPMELRTAGDVFVSLLPLAIEVRIRQKINSLDVLSFAYPACDPVWEGLQVGAMVRFAGQDYRIITDASSRGTEPPYGIVQAEQYFVGLGDTLVRKLELKQASPAAAMESALSGTGWSVGAAAPSEPVSATFDWASPLAILFAIADMTNGELWFDTQATAVYLLTQRGTDRGAALIYRKNVVGLDREVSADKLYNRIYYEGAEGLTNMGGGYVEDAVSIAMYGRRDYFWGDTTITSLQTLIYGATLRLAAYKQPRAKYTCMAYNLQPSSAHASWATAELGDTVRVYDEGLGVNGVERVFEREWAPYEPTVPDALTLYSDREWFPNLSEVLADIVNKPEPDKPGANACKGAGGYNWLNLAGVPLAWKGDGLPHIWTSTWGRDDPDDGLPLLMGDVWYAGNNVGGEIAYDGPCATDVDGTWEGCTDWLPRGLDLDADGVEDFWPFGTPGDLGQAGGHDYTFTDQPTSWDYAGGDGPYPATDYLGAGAFADLSGYVYYGYDTDGNGIPETWDEIANLPNPLFRSSEADGLMWGIDLGGGDIGWEAAGDTALPLWHSYGTAGNLYLTGWSRAGQRNASGPIGTLADGVYTWDPVGYDANDDGHVDFWPYGNGGDYGRDWIGNNPTANVAVAACGQKLGESPAVPPPTVSADACAIYANTLELNLGGLAPGDMFFATNNWSPGVDTTVDNVQAVCTPHYYDDVRLGDLSVLWTSSTQLTVVGWIVSGSPGTGPYHADVLVVTCGPVGGGVE